MARGAILAPMAGVADTAFRIVCRQCGATATVSEMISVKGLCYGDKKSAMMCRITPQERPCGIQLFGSEPDFFARAVPIVLGYEPDWIDINMGCPVKKVTAIGAGSALMDDVENAAAVVQKTVAASRVPVTVKCRLGRDEDHVNCIEFAKAMAQAGATAITLHARTRKQMYSGVADWDKIRAVHKAVTIPVVGNGDVVDNASYEKMMRQTGCDGVAVGRGALGNPTVFREIATGEPLKITVEERMAIMLYHVRLVLEYAEKPEAVAMHEARKHAAWYMKGIPEAAALRRACYALESYADAENLAARAVASAKSRA